MAYKIISVACHPSWAEEIKSIAKSQNISTSHYIKDAVDFYKLLDTALVNTILSRATTVYKNTINDSIKTIIQSDPITR